MLSVVNYQAYVFIRRKRERKKHVKSCLCVWCNLHCSKVFERYQYGQFVCLKNMHVLSHTPHNIHVRTYPNWMVPIWSRSKWKALQSHHKSQCSMFTWDHRNLIAGNAIIHTKWPLHIVCVRLCARVRVNCACLLGDIVECTVYTYINGCAVSGRYRNGTPNEHRHKNQDTRAQKVSDNIQILHFYRYQINVYRPKRNKYKHE